MVVHLPRRQRALQRLAVGARLRILRRLERHRRGLALHHLIELLVDLLPLSQTFTVKADPRWKVSPADLVAQFDFLIQVRDKVSEANDAVITARDVKLQVADRLKQAPQLGDQGKALSGKVTEVEGEIYQIKNQSSQDPLNYPIKLNNKIAALLGMAGSSPGRPPAQAFQVLKELNGKLDVQTKRMEKVYAEDLKAFNEQLKKLGLPEVTPKKKAPKVAAD